MTDREKGVKRKKRLSKLERQDLFTFELYEDLKFIVKDLENITRLIPSEVSRIIDAATKDEGAAIAISRKRNLLIYIKTIAEDHIHWTKKRLKDGFIAKEVKGE